MDTFQFEGRVYEIRPQPTGQCTGCAFEDRACDREPMSLVIPHCINPHQIFVEVQQPAEPQQPAARSPTRLVPLRQKALHTLEETTISDPQVAFWGVSITGVPMIRLATLADAQLVQRLADAAFQAGRQKAFSDLLGFVEGQR